MRCTSVLVRVFQSTLSVRRATVVDFSQFGEFLISIHALREESDRLRAVGDRAPKDFNPRSP